MQICTNIGDQKRKNYIGLHQIAIDLAYDHLDLK